MRAGQSAELDLPEAEVENLNVSIPLELASLQLDVVVQLELVKFGQAVVSRSRSAAVRKLPDAESHASLVFCNAAHLGNSVSICDVSCHELWI